MSFYRFARLIRPSLARLGGVFLALAVLLPGAPAPLQAASVPLRVRSGPAVNHNPVANPDNLLVFAGEDYQTLFLLDNDTDIDLDPLTIYSTTATVHGDVYRPNDFLEIEYKPYPGFLGVDTLKYKVIDGQGGSAIGTFTVTVVPQGGVGTTSSSFAVNSCFTSPAGCDTSYWKVNPNSGATGDTASGACNGAPGLGVTDAWSWDYELRGAFNTGLTLWVDNQQVIPRLPMTVTHYSLVSGPVTMTPPGTRVTVHYDGLIGSDTLRTDVSFGNPTASTMNFTVTLASNVGSNAATVIDGSSTNDTNFTTADRWLVTSKSGGAPFKLVDTHVLFGPGSPLVHPSAVYTTTFKCGETPPNSQGVRADFSMSVPPHATRRLLFFNQIHQTSAAALTDAAIFNAEPVGLLAGLTNGELAQVVNWKLSPISYLYLSLVRR